MAEWRATWVPVDRRWFGLDRRTLLPAGLVVLLFAVANGVLPALNRAVTVDDPIRAGDVVQVGPAVQFTPAVGANLVAGLRQGNPSVSGYPGTAAVSYQGTVFQVTADAFAGTPAQLIDQVLRNAGAVQVSGDPVTITNETGEHGVAVHIDGANSIGLVAAYVFAGVGVEIETAGPRTVADGVTQEVAAMLRSVRPVGAAR